MPDSDKPVTDNEEPNRFREAMMRMDGLSQLRAIFAMPHLAPPMSRTLDFHLVSADPDRVVFEGTPSAAHLNPLGTIHGGWAAAIMDSAMACAVHASLAPGETYSTVEYKINLVRPLMPGMGVVRCTGTLVSRGRRIATSEGRLEDGQGRLLAHGTETCLISPLQPA